MMIIPEVVWEHAEEASLLYAIRRRLVESAVVDLSALSRSDERLAAHLDGLAIAGESAWSFCAAALEGASASAIFVAAVRSIEDKHQQRLDRLLALAEASPDARAGLLSAFGWLEREQLLSVVAALLASPDPFRRMVGITACSMHRVDPGLVSARRILDACSLVRARALRTAGEIGCLEAVRGKSDA